MQTKAGARWAARPVPQGRNQDRGAMPVIPNEWKNAEQTPLDFIVVGAGAGGAPLAARLVERGYTVLVVEMGPEKPAPLEGAGVENTEVPLLHSETTEDARHSLRFFVKHFDEDPSGS